MDLGIFGALLAIIAIDLVLSGDNAVVIGMAARRLPPHQRRQAIVWGGVGAIVLRIVFTIVAALLLDVPLIQAVGGILLIWIAFKLLRPFEPAHEDLREADTMGAAIRTIILADAVMSLDNMIAVGGASHGNLWLLLFGLALSIPILLVGSGLISMFITRYPWLNYLGAAILVYTAMEMFFADDFVHQHLHLSRVGEFAITAIWGSMVIAYGIVASRRSESRSPRTDPHSASRSSQPEALDG